VGRTGRAGLAGRAVSLVSSAERHLLRDIERLLPATIEQVALDGFESNHQTHDAAIPTGRRLAGHMARSFTPASRRRSRPGRVRVSRRPGRP
jgi:superfamily II DNA/RNA helicase